MSPFFSIIVPTYNRAALISATIQSIFNQTFADFEIIVVDDGGSDNTEEMMNAIIDSRFQFYKIKNGERGAARNFGIKKAKGRYITFIDSDDILYPHAFQNAKENIERLSFPYCFAQAFEMKEAISEQLISKGTFVKQETINQQLLSGNFLACIGVFISKEVFDSLLFEEERQFAGTEDWLLWLQCAARYPFYFSNRVCACMIEHAARSVLSFSEEKLLYRTNHIKNVLKADEKFISSFGPKSVDRVYAHMLSYTALHLAMTDKKMKAMHYLAKAILVNKNELFKRRTLGIIKNIILR